MIEHTPDKVVTVGGELAKRLERHTGPVSGVAFSPDGKRIVSGSSDKTLIIWPTSSLKP